MIRWPQIKINQRTYKKARCFYLPSGKTAVTVPLNVTIVTQSSPSICYGGCTLSQREYKTLRERKCKWKHSTCLGHSCLASLAIAFLAVRDVRVKRSCVSPGFRLVSRAKIKYTLRHILVLIFDSFFFNPHSQIFSVVWKEASMGINTFGEVRNFWKKKIKNFDYPEH